MSEEVIATDPAKVEKICNLSEPKDKGGIRSILGLGNYYKRFTKSYCVITAHLQELLKKSEVLLLLVKSGLHTLYRLLVHDHTVQAWEIAQ